MKNVILTAAILGFAACTSCRKDDTVPSTDVPENTWRYAGTTLQGAYTDITIKKGYLLIFHPPAAGGLTQSISFQFRARPQSANTYKPAPDTSAADHVRINLETGASPGYYSVGNDNVRVQATIVAGKLKLTGNGIRIVRDTIPSLADTLILSFNLTEF